MLWLVRVCLLMFMYILVRVLLLEIMFMLEFVLILGWECVLFVVYGLVMMRLLLLDLWL